MENPEEKSPEEILKDELKQAEENGTFIAKQGRDFTREGQRISDIAHATGNLLENAPDLIDIEAQIEYWSDVNTHTRTTLNGLQYPNNSLTSASGTVSTAYTDIISSPAFEFDDNPLLFTAPDLPPKI